MHSGFVTPKRVVKKIGIHQKFDLAAYRMTEAFWSPGTFPNDKQIIHFEGLNGPDGLKVKSPGEDQASHLYDPVADKGEVPLHIEQHYQRLVENLKIQDLIRAAFEAAWLAHYVTDGMTPAHHFPLEKHLLALKSDDPRLRAETWLTKHLLSGQTSLATLKKNWAVWGKKGLLSTHFNFEMGVSMTLLLFPIRGKLDSAKLAQARRMGPIQFFKQEARDIAGLKLYEQFYERGWSSDIAAAVRHRLAPQTAQTIGIIWLLAYLEAGFRTATEAHRAQVSVPVKV